MRALLLKCRQKNTPLWPAMTHYAVSKANRRFAKSMRRAMTEAELKLWNELRAHRLMGLAFRRQMPIAGYIVDFACPAKKLVIEVDGSQHGDDINAARDAYRTRTLQSLGWTVLRFWNDDILRDVDNVCQHIVISAGLAEPGYVPCEPQWESRP